jgi:putative glutamine amidotransferase
MPLIGITAGEIFNLERPWAPVTYGQSHTYVDAIIKAGGIPVIFPLTFDMEVIDELCQRVDGVLLSGGNDISPQRYGQKPSPKIGSISDLRDGVETRIFENLLDSDKPLLAICRGHQMLNVHLGGTLYQDIPTDLPGSLNHESSTEAEDIEHQAHELKIDPDSKLAAILETTSLLSNTHHHQAVNKLGSGLLVTARSEDGIIEAMETDDDRFIIAIQAHPESLGRVLPKWSKLFTAFVEEAKKAVPAY